MSNAALATVVPIHVAAQSPLEALAARYLRAKRAIAEAEEVIAAIGPELIVALREDGERGAAIADLGAVRVIEVAPAMRFDERAARALLEKHGEAVPLRPTGGGTQLRATLV